MHLRYPTLVHSNCFKLATWLGLDNFKCFHLRCAIRREWTQIFETTFFSNNLSKVRVFHLNITSVPIICSGRVRQPYKNLLINSYILSHNFTCIFYSCSLHLPRCFILPVNFSLPGFSITLYWATVSSNLKLLHHPQGILLKLMLTALHPLLRCWAKWLWPSCHPESYSPLLFHSILIAIDSRIINSLFYSNQSFQKILRLGQIEQICHSLFIVWIVGGAVRSPNLYIVIH